MVIGAYASKYFNIGIFLTIQYKLFYCNFFPFLFTKKKKRL